jgi:hypothetical protein
MLSDVYTYDNILEYFQYYEKLNGKRVLKSKEYIEVDMGDHIDKVPKPTTLDLFDKISLHNETEMKNRAHCVFLTIFNKLIQRAGHELEIQYTQPYKIIKDDSDDDFVTNKEKLIIKILKSDHTQYDYDDLIWRQSKSDLTAIEKIVLNKIKFMKLFEFESEDKIDKTKFETYLNVYLGNEVRYDRYKRMFDIDSDIDSTDVDDFTRVPVFTKKIQHQFDTMTRAKEKSRLKIIVDMYNLFSGKSHKGFQLPEFKRRTLLESEYKKGMNRIVNSSIYFKDAYHNHSLFFQSKSRLEKPKSGSKTKKRNFVASKSHIRFIKDLLKTYNIIIKEGKRIQKNKKREYTYLLSLDREIKNIVHCKI